MLDIVPDFEVSFRQMLIQLFGASVGERVYWNKVNDKPAYPHLRLTTIADTSIRNHSKASIGECSIQIDVLDIDKNQCNQLALNLKKMLDGFTGDILNFSVFILVKTVPSSWEPVSREFRRIVEVDIKYVQR